MKQGVKEVAEEVGEDAGLLAGTPVHPPTLIQPDSGREPCGCPLACPDSHLWARWVFPHIPFTSYYHASFSAIGSPFDRSAVNRGSITG